MNEGFIDLRSNPETGAGGDTFWPSFTDIMMVIVMIFMMASTVLVLRNWDLVKELRATIEAENQAKELARSMTETSATLEEQLAQAQHINSEMRMQLMRADENRQSMQEQLSAQQQQILVLTEEQQRLASSLQQSRRAGQQSADQLAKVSADHGQLTVTHAALQKRLQQVLDELAESEQGSQQQASELAALRLGSTLTEQQLYSLQNEYSELQIKYDKLFRPARSAEGKHVVTVRYWKEGDHYQLRIKDTGEADYRVTSREELNRELAALKEKHSNKLYVKLIIPDDSGLSYNEAWGFTVEMLDKYDYYHQK